MPRFSLTELQAHHATATDYLKRMRKRGSYENEDAMLPEGTVPAQGTTASGQSIAATAQQLAANYPNVKYDMGAKDPAKGYLDCSGFATLVLRKAAGIVVGNSKDVMHDKRFDTIPFSEMQPGDLFVRQDSEFTDKYEGHVAIYLGNNQMVDMAKPPGYISIHPLYKNIATYTVRRLRGTG